MKNLFFTAFHIPQKSKYLCFTFTKCLFVLFVLCQINLAQREKPPIDSAPPPLKILSKSEKSQLDAEKDIRKRTRLALELLEARLAKAEDLNSKEEYKNMFNELGGYHALVDYTITFLKRNNTGRGRSLDNFKRLEISLRRQITRIEIIRRDLPARYDFYVQGLVRKLRDARSRAVEPLFGNTVVPDNDLN
jgi:hypothetical protein